MRRREGMAGTGPKRRVASFGLRYVFSLSYLFNLLLTIICIERLSTTTTLRKPKMTNRACDGQLRPTQVMQPTIANTGHPNVNASQRRPTQAKEGPRPPTTACNRSTQPGHHTTMTNDNTNTRMMKGQGLQTHVCEPWYVSFLFLIVLTLFCR
jgi:hypothetical protein